MGQVWLKPEPIENALISLNRTLTAISLAAALSLVGCAREDYDSYLAAGRQALGRNDPKVAVIQLRNALQKRPDAGEARFLLGQAFLASGDAAAAEIEFDKAGELNHPQEQVAPVLARLLLAKRQPKRVIERFAEVHLQEAAAEADLLTTLAAAYELQGDAAQSRRALTGALEAVKDFPPALVLQSRLEARVGDFAQALALVNQALAANPGLAEAWRLKGDYLSSTNAAPADAMEAYRKALSVKQNDAAAHERVMNLLLADGDIAGAQAQLEAMRRALPGQPGTLRYDMLLAYQRRDLQRARDIGQQLLKIAPENPLALQLAGAVEYELHSFIRAEDYLGKALAMSPNLATARRMLAQLYLQTGQAARALKVLAPALQAERPDTQMLSLAGEAYLQSGDLKNAEQAFQRAARSDPSEPRGRTVLALSKISRGAAQVGFDELRAIAASDEGSGADMALIRAHLRRREFDQALSGIAALERKFPDKAVAPNLRGLVLLARNDVTGARKNFEEALAREPAFFPAAATLAALDLAEKRHEQALKRFDAILAVDPNNLRATLAKAEVRERSGAGRDEIAKLIGSAVQQNPESAGPRIALVDFQLRQHDIKAALRAAQDAVAANPGNPELLDTLGRVQLLSGDTNQAIDTYNRLLRQLRQSPVPYQRLAEANLVAKNLPAAELNLRRALELAPELASAQRRLVEVQLVMKKPKEALAIAATMERQHPEQALGFMLEGDIHTAEKHWGEAAKAYRVGLTKSGGSELAIRLHATLLLGGDRPQADKFASDWMKQHADDLPFIIYLGDEASMRGDLAQAERRYREVLRQQADSALALNNLAWVTQRQKKTGARAYAEKAVTLDPNNVAYLDTLAEVLASERQLTKALEVQKKAVELQPDNPALRLRLAKICVEVGDKVQARQNLERLMNASAPFPGQSEVEPLLRSL